MDTHSHPGHLMLKLLGPGLGTGFGPAGGSSLKLSDYPPPWEIETSFIAPDDSIPWNYWMNFIVLDKQGQEPRHVDAGRRKRPEGEAAPAVYPGATFKLRFRAGDPRVDPGAQAARHADPVPRRLARAARFSQHAARCVVPLRDLRCEARPRFEIGEFGMHCWSTTTGRMYGAGPGGPMYQKFLIDYVHYRYGISAPLRQ